MDDIRTRFSCLLDVGSPVNAARALEIYNGLVAEAADEDPPSHGFNVSIVPEHGGATLRLRSGETGDPERLIAFVTLCAAAFGLTGRWGFSWADTSERSRPGAFNGGAHVLDLATGQTVAWVHTALWLDDTIKGGGDA